MVRMLLVFGLLFSAHCNCSGVIHGQEAATSLVKRTAGTIRQQEWLAATPSERVRLAESIGDEGARASARAKGYELIYDGVTRAIPQGPDQVYRATNGRVIVYEAKGGGGQLGHAYGYLQGTTEWAVESAKRVLRSSKASKAERRAAKEILDAAVNGQLEVHVVRTSHVLGEPTATVLEHSMVCSDDAARLAKTAVVDLVRAASGTMDDAARTTDDVVHVATQGGKVTKTVAKVVLPIAVAVDAGFRVSHGVNIEQRYSTAEVTLQQREVEHARNAAGMVGGWAGAWAGAQLGGFGGGATGTVVAPGPGTAIGGVVGSVSGGVVGFIGGEVAAEAAAEWTINRVHAAGATVVGSAEAAWNGTCYAAHSTVSGVRHAWNWARGN